MDEAPVGTNLGVCKQPFHRARTKVRLNFRNLGYLFGKVHMNGTIGADLANAGQGVGRDGP